MLRIIGKPYIFQHIKNMCREESIRVSYMAYVTDTLKGLCGAEQRWYDHYAQLDEKPEKPQQNAEEIKQKFMDWWNGGDES